MLRPLKVDSFNVVQSIVLSLRLCAAQEVGDFLFHAANGKLLSLATWHGAWRTVIASTAKRPNQPISALLKDLKLASCLGEPVLGAAGDSDVKFTSSGPDLLRVV